MTRRRYDWRALALATWALSGCTDQIEGGEPGEGDEPEAHETQSAALNNGLALTPPMGWNSWNKLGCNDLNEGVVRQIADAMVSSGMKAAGYQYVVLDDCWQTSRDGQGKIVADAQKFPSGIKALADYVHAKGLKFGIYTDAGTATCQGRPGSLNHEAQDAATYASWGVDYVKVDWCNSAGLDPSTQYGVFRNAIASSGRPMVFSICNWGEKSPWLWGPSTGHLWRTTYDIFDTWGSMLSNTAGNNYPLAAKPGAWNDPDMLEVGNGGMTDTEYRAHMSLWAVMGAPLIAGNDLRSMSAATRTTLTNPEMIAVDQDAAGAQGYPVTDSGNGLQVWSKRLNTTGSRAVVLLNKTSVTQPITASWADLGVSGNAAVRDLWARTDRGTFNGSYTAVVPAHGAVMLKLAGASEAAPPTPKITIKNTDTRTVSNVRVEVEFYVDGFRHYDYEDITTFDKSFTFALTGQNGTWDGSKLVGPFLTLQSSAAGAKNLTIVKTDTRPVVDVRLTVSFQVNGATHWDVQGTGDFVGQQSLVLNGLGGTQQGSTWLGDFLHPWGSQDESAPTAELVWPNATNKANSSAWLRANHASLKRVEPRVLVLDVINRPNSTPLDEFLPKLVDAFAEGSRYRAFLPASANAAPFVNYKIDKVVNLRDPNGAEYPSFWPVKTANGWDVGSLFSTTFAQRLGYPDPNVAGRFLTMCELFEKGVVNELWISAGDRNIYENQSHLQIYDTNLAPVPGSFNNNTNGTFYDPANRVTCNVSVRMQEINTTRGEGCGTHAAGHAQERLHVSIPYLSANAKRFFGQDLDTRFGLARDSLYACDYASGSCVDRPTPGRMTSKELWLFPQFDVTNWGAGCGNVHFPPNARYHYDYSAATPALSTCEGYGLGTGGVDTTTSYTSTRANTYESMHPDCGGGWMMYMGQSMPGLGNQAKAVSGQPMLNWWPFLYY